MEATVSLFWDPRRSKKERGRDGSLAAARTVVVKLVGAGGTLLHGLTRTTGNRDRIRRTVGERNVSRIFPSRSADPVPPWRQPLLHLPLLPSLRRGSNRFSPLPAPCVLAVPRSGSIAGPGRRTEKSPILIISNGNLKNTGSCFLLTMPVAERMQKLPSKISLRSVSASSR